MMTFNDAWARVSAPYRRAWWAYTTFVRDTMTRLMNWVADRYEPHG